MSAMPAVFGPEAQQALLLSTLAGLSTGIGGVIAVSSLSDARVLERVAIEIHDIQWLLFLQIIKKPENKLLAALLGVAIGVMVTLSTAEMYIRNAMEHGWLGISTATAAGMLVYYFLQPYFPDFEPVPATATKQASTSFLRKSLTLMLGPEGTLRFCSYSRINPQKLPSTVK